MDWPGLREGEEADRGLKFALMELGERVREGARKREGRVVAMEREVGEEGGE